MEIVDMVEFCSDDPHGNFKKGDSGILLGFISGGDNTPCGVVRHKEIYEAVPLYFLRPHRDKAVKLKESIFLCDKF